MPEHKFTNKLIDETSPYLLQHAHNPVDWYPWGPEPLGRAREENKPILLSIGYSACHWCHVMERESFENEEIAGLMNELFVPIKVDREERPDLDDIYMNAVQMMTGSGGWPLTVFLTPDLKPFFGGTYFPPMDHLGRPGFKTVLERISETFREQPDKVAQNAHAVTENLRSMTHIPSSREILSPELIGKAVRDWTQRFDPSEGGFTPAPKFPPSGAIFVLLRYYRAHKDDDALQMALLTLDKMAGGGMYDHLGGGFHRYSTDERWFAPHFEKMLYDNALLTLAYLEAFQVTGNARYAQVARETLEYVLREMQGPEGGYFSSEDADSEGIEGKFYVWSHEELVELLGEESEVFCRYYGVVPQGNWEGHNILHTPRDLEGVSRDLNRPADELRGVLEVGRRSLLQVRSKRVRPGLDDKVLTSWNGLMISAMARGFRILGDRRFLDSARRAAKFVLENMSDQGRLLATYRQGRSRFPAYLDDYAFLMSALVELYESDFDIGWLESAAQLAEGLDRLFRDESSGGFHFTGSDHEQLLVRSKSGFDGAIPSGNAMAALSLLKLSTYSGREDYARRAQETMRAFQVLLERAPSAFAHMLCALDYYIDTPREVAVVGKEDSPETREALERIWSVFDPRTAVAFLDPDWPHRQKVEDQVPLLKGKEGAEHGPVFYVCEDYACKAPTESLDAVEEALRGSA